MNIHLDITTQSLVYNPLSPAGQWVHHRFGKRSISLELSCDIINEIVNHDSVSSITLYSIFGDPCCHSKVEEVFDIIKNSNKHCTIITYGMNKDAMTLAKEYNFSIFVKVCEHVFLNSDIDTVLNNCKDYDNIMIEETLFKHNTHSNIKEVCKTNNWSYFTNPGVETSGFCSSVIDESGQWLYDVHKQDTIEPNTLVKTTKGWHRLKMFVKPVQGTSIVNKPNIPTLSNISDDFLPDNDTVFVCVSGHVIKNIERAVIFSNALCSDWDPYKLRADEHYERGILEVLNQFRKVDLNNIDIHYNTFSDITPFC